MASPTAQINTSSLSHSAASNSSSTAKPGRNAKLIAKNVLISAAVATIFVILAAAAVSQIVLAGFMFSIGLVPDGMYLLAGGILCGVMAGVALNQLCQYSVKTHQSLHPKS